MSVLVVCVAVGVTAATTTVLVPVVDALVDRQRAHTAADAAALAGVTGGRAAAEALATANGGTLVSFTTSGPDVVVEVSVGEQVVRARATNGP